MKRLLYILLICFSSSLILAQKSKADQIIKTNGFTIKAKVISTKGDKITYQLPGESYVVQLKKEEVQKIIFHDGEVMEFNVIVQSEETKEDSIQKEEKEEKTTVVIEEKTTTKEDLDSISWVNIKITEDPEEVAGLKEIGNISGFAEGGKINTPTDVLLGMAIADLKKEAALLNAHTVLVKEIKHNRAYGDLPKTVIEGIAYGD